MERDFWFRALMVFTVFGLLGLILVTPSLLGRQAEIASLPILVIGMTTQNRSMFVIDVSGAIQAYMYANITLEVKNANTSYWKNWTEEDTYNVHAFIPTGVEPFQVRTYIEDRQHNYFEYNVTVDLGEDAEGRPAMLFAFPDPPSPDAVTRVPPEDLRVAVPLRGSR